MYQYALCLYKQLKYHHSDNITGLKIQQRAVEALFKSSDVQDQWLEVDQSLRQSVEDYKKLTVDIKGFKQTIFLDHVIRLTLCRAHANSQAKRFITADKLLGLADKMINMVKNGDPYAKLIGIN